MNKFILTALLLSPLFCFCEDPGIYECCPQTFEILDAQVLKSPKNKIIIKYKNHYYLVTETEHHFWCECYNSFDYTPSNNIILID